MLAETHWNSTQITVRDGGATAAANNKAAKMYIGAHTPSAFIKRKREENIQFARSVTNRRNSTNLSPLQKKNIRKSTDH